MKKIKRNGVQDSESREGSFLRLKVRNPHACLLCLGPRQRQAHVLTLPLLGCLSDPTYPNYPYHVF